MLWKQSSTTQHFLTRECLHQWRHSGMTYRERGQDYCIPFQRVLHQEDCKVTSSSRCRRTWSLTCFIPPAVRAAWVRRRPGTQNLTAASPWRIRLLLWSMRLKSCPFSLQFFLNDAASSRNKKIFHVAVLALKFLWQIHLLRVGNTWDPNWFWLNLREGGSCLVSSSTEAKRLTGPFFWAFSTAWEFFHTLLEAKPRSKCFFFDEFGLPLHSQASNLACAFSLPQKLHLCWTVLLLLPQSLHFSRPYCI